MNKPARRSKERFLVFGMPAIEEAEIDEVVPHEVRLAGLRSKVAAVRGRFQTLQGCRTCGGSPLLQAALPLSMIAAASAQGGRG